MQDAQEGLYLQPAIAMVLKNRGTVRQDWSDRNTKEKRLFATMRAVLLSHGAGATDNLITLCSISWGISSSMFTANHA